MDSTLPVSGVSTAQLAAQAVRLLCRWPDAQLDRFFAQLEAEHPLRRAEVAEVAARWRDERDEVRLLGLEGVLHTGRLPMTTALPPSRLLLAAYEAVGFVGRETELDDLLGWSHADGAVSVRLITGEGGCGKTRLMQEVCSRLRAEGWAAGFVQTECALSTRHIDTLMDCGARRLVVFDYAETRMQDVQQFLLGLLAFPHPFPLRVVLLARNAGDWWSELLDRNTQVAHLLLQQPPLALPPLFTSIAKRRDHFHTAAAAFADALETPLRPHVHHPLREAALSHPLYLWMAALAFTQGRVISSPAQLLTETLAHERRFWRRWLEDRLGNPVRLKSVRRWIDPVVAGLTLVGGLPTEEAVRALVRDIGRTSEGRLDEVVDLVRELYPGPAAQDVQGLQPNVLGEHLVGEALQETIEILKQALLRSTESTFTVLGRLAQRQAPMTRWLEQALHDSTQPVRLAAIRAAVHVGPPMETVLMRTVFAGNEPMSLPELRELAAACPEHTTALRQVGLVLMERLNAAAEAETWDNTSWSEQRCAWLLRLTHRQHQMHQPVAMMQSAQQALAMAKRLVREHGEPFEGLLLNTHINLAVAHNMNGQTAQAVATYEQALPLARRQTGTERRATLAFLLKNLTAGLTESADPARAVTLGEEAVHVLRQLAEAEAHYTHDLVMALNNTALALFQSDQKQRARVLIREAVALVGGLYAAKPDALREEFVRVLGNGIRFAFETGNAEEARGWLVQYGEAVGAMLVTNPDIFLWNMEQRVSSLFVKLYAQARSAGLHREVDALNAVMVQARSQLLQAHERLAPRERAVSLDHNSNMLLRMGQPGEALLAARKARGIWQQLRTDNPSAQVDEAINLAIIAEALKDLGQPREAIVSAWEALLIHRERLSREAERQDAQRRLIWCARFLAALLDEDSAHAPAVCLRWEALAHLRALIRSGDGAPDVLFPQGLQHVLGQMLLQTAHHTDPGRAVQFMQEAGELQVSEPLLQAELNLWGELFLRRGAALDHHPEPEPLPKPLHMIVVLTQHPGIFGLLKSWAEAERRTPSPWCSLITELALLDVALEPIQGVMFQGILFLSRETAPQ